MSQLILQSKITIPPERDNIIIRSRLLTRLTELTNQYSLVVLSAPAGSGKTSLVSQWASQTPLAVAWLSLDETDNDPVRFWRTGLAALQQSLPDLESTPALAWLESGQPFDPTTWLTILEQSWPQEVAKCVLILDDFQVITNQLLLTTLNLWLDYLPAKFSVVLSSRTEPPLALPRRRVRRQLGELAAANLNFTRDETALFLRQIMHLSLAEETIDQLVTKTEGWAAGLQLAALALQNQPASPTPLKAVGFSQAEKGLNSPLFAYLAQEIFEQQTADIQTFLLQTAVPDSFTEDLATGLTQLDLATVQTRLNSLEKLHLFLIPLTDKSWRYHQLWTDFLRSRLASQEPELNQLLLSKVAAWWEARQAYAEAIRYSLVGQDYAKVVQLIEQQIEGALGSNQFVTLRSWIEALPKYLQEQNPKIRLAYAWTLALSGELERANLELDNLVANEAGLVTEMLALRAVIANLQGTTGQAIQYAEQALKDLPQTHFYYSILGLMLGIAYQFGGLLAQAEAILLKALASSKAANNSHLVLTTQSSLAELEISKGNLYRAHKIYQEALKLIEQNPQSPLSGMIYYGLANLMLEWNKLAEAEKYLTESLKLGQPYGNKSALALVFTAKAQVALSQHNLELAEQFTQQAAKLAENSVMPFIAGRVEAWQVRLAMAANKSEVVFSWLQANQQANWQPTFQSYEYLTCIRGFVQQNKLGEAAAKLETGLKVYQAGEHKHLLLETLLIKAVIYYRLGNLAGAQKLFAEVLNLAESGGYLRIFREYSQEVSGLVRNVPKPENRSVFWEQLTDFLQISEINHPQLISERELEVLRLLALGYTNHAIAEQLVISRGTVKTHLNHIYEKLEAHSRTQALAKAKALGIL